MNTPVRIVGALLAAGSGSRFGGGKLDAVIDGTTVGARTLATLRGSGCDHVLIIVPPDAPGFAQNAGAGVTLVTNAVPDDGLGSSIALAAGEAIHRNADALLVALADMPLISASTLAALVRPGILPQTIRAACTADGRTGPPALFGSAWLPELALLTGETGARSLLKREAAWVEVVPITAVEALDLDTTGDLDAIREHWRCD